MFEAPVDEKLLAGLIFEVSCAPRIPLGINTSFIMAQMPFIINGDCIKDITYSSFVLLLLKTFTSEG